MQPAVYAITTMDTKGSELAFVAEALRSAGVRTLTVDVGTLGKPAVTPDIPREKVAGETVPPSNPPEQTDRGTAVSGMGQRLRDFLVEEHAAGRVLGVIGLGGSGGTALITTAMRALPIGCPKLMVSTVASGNVAPYVDCHDIMMLYSVVDIAGLNSVSEVVLRNAAHAMAGMVEQPAVTTTVRPTVGMTMFGVTTPCVTEVRQRLEAKGYDCLVFHATGSGGRAMEQLVASGLIGGVLDITTTEVADEVVGGVFPCGPERFDRLLESRVPLVLSLGALDMVNFGGIDSVPSQFCQRNLHIHNPQVTLMRTSVDENVRIGRWIADKLNRSMAPLTLLVPEGGLSLLDLPGQPFHDPQADAALFDTLSQRLDHTDDRRLVRLPYALNASEFSQALVDEFLRVASG